jgi:Protein of unknown function (DUF2442)
MYKLVRTTEVTVVGDHRLRLRFEDGVEGEVDFSGLGWNGVFAPLKDPAYFARVRLGLGTIVWPNEADIAPETLYHWVTAGLGPNADA